MLLRGVSPGPWDIWQGTLVEQDFIDLKAKGMDYVKFQCHLGHLVDENWDFKVSNVTGKSVLDTWKNHATWAAKAGMLWTPDISLYGEGISPHLNQTTFWDSAHHSSFVDLWRALALVFVQMPGCASLHPLHVPGHKGTGNELDWNNLTADLIDAIREVTGMPISWMPFRFGWDDWDGGPCHTGWYAHHDPLPDDNIIYGFNHYSNTVRSTASHVAHMGEAYNGDASPLLWHLTPAINFKQTHDVSMGCWEWGLNIGGHGGWPLVEPSRLLWVEDMKNFFLQYGFSWAYWNYAIPSGVGEDYWSIMETTRSYREELVTILASESVTLNYASLPLDVEALINGIPVANGQQLSVGKGSIVQIKVPARIDV